MWHNYSFDRHVIYNHGIDVKGLGGDTMHMARLFDPSKGPKEYSLARLTDFYKVMINKKREKMFPEIEEQLKQKLLAASSDAQKDSIRQ